MKTLLPAVAVLLVSAAAATHAHAAIAVAKMTDSNCIALRDQLQQALAGAKAGTKRQVAQYYGTEGRSYCLTGHPQDGAAAYRKALQALGEKPAV